MATRPRGRPRKHWSHSISEDCCQMMDLSLTWQHVKLKTFLVLMEGVHEAVQAIYVAMTVKKGNGRVI